MQATLDLALSLGGAGTSGGGGGGDVPVTITAATNLAAGTAVSVNSSGQAVQTWGPAPNVTGVQTVDNIGLYSVTSQAFQGPFAAVLSTSQVLLMAQTGNSTPGSTCLSMTPATVSGTTLSLGTKSTAAAATGCQGIIPLTATTFICIYLDSGDALRAAVGTISAGAISFGTGAAIGTSGSNLSSQQSLIGLSSTLAVIGVDDGATENLFLYALSVSGTTVTVGTAVNLGTTSLSAQFVALSATKFALAFSDDNANLLKVSIGTIAGTTITQTTTSSGVTTNFAGIAMFDATHIVVGAAAVGPSSGPPNPVTLIAASISGNVPTFGAPVVATNAFLGDGQSYLFILMGGLDSTHAVLAAHLALPQLVTLTAPNTIAISAAAAITDTNTPTLFELSQGRGVNAGVPNIVTNLSYSALVVHSATTVSISDGLADIFSVDTTGGAINAISPHIQHRSTWEYYLWGVDATRMLATFITWDGRFQARIVSVNQPNASGPIGCVATGVTAGNPATIVTTGPCGGFTGLTAGQQYYANGDGTVTTGDTGHPIGVAISTTQLAVSLG